MWDRMSIDMGEVRDNSTLAFSFRHAGLISDVKLQPSCGCTIAKWIPDTNTIIGNVDVGIFPKHLRQNGTKEFLFIKTITVSYTENYQNKNDILIIKAKLL